MQKTKIEWCDSTWNPVTGCLHGCEYCYARRIANRFGFHAHEPDIDVRILRETPVSGGKKVPYPFDFEPTLHCYRLEEPQGIKTPQNIFVCSMAEKAAVVWCILNRVDDDRWGDSIAEVVTAPHQFAYDAGAPVTDDLRRLAEDVLERWKREKEGETEVGRVLPPEYVFFDGDGSHNHFRMEYEHTGEYWEFEAESPYGEERG